MVRDVLMLHGDYFVACFDPAHERKDKDMDIDTIRCLYPRYDLLDLTNYVGSLHVIPCRSVA